RRRCAEGAVERDHVRPLPDADAGEHDNGQRRGQRLDQPGIGAARRDLLIRLVVFVRVLLVDRFAWRMPAVERRTRIVNRVRRLQHRFGELLASSLLLVRLEPPLLFGLGQREAPRCRLRALCALGCALKTGRRRALRDGAQALRADGCSAPSPAPAQVRPGGSRRDVLWAAPPIAWIGAAWPPTSGAWPPRTAGPIPPPPCGPIPRARGARA